MHVPFRWCKFAVVCGCLRLFVVGCGWLRLVAVGCGWLRLFAVGCGWLRLFAVVVCYSQPRDSLICITLGLEEEKKNSEVYSLGSLARPS